MIVEVLTRGGSVDMDDFIGRIIHAYGDTWKLGGHECSSNISSGRGCRMNR